MQKCIIYERTVKTSGESDQVYVNGVFSGGSTNTAKFSLYVSLKGMEIRGRKGLTFYFSTASTTLRVEQYNNNGAASLYIHRGFKGVMLLGHMDVVDDAESRRVVWHEGDEFYYPRGFDDPTFKVLRFTPLRGRLNASKGVHDFVIG